MKNKVIQLKKNGKWAIKKGTYLTNYVFDTEAEALEASLVKNVQDLHYKMGVEYEKLVKAYPEKYANIYEYKNGEKATLGDILA